MRSFRWYLVILLSFVVVGIYWVNHHYLIDGLKQVTHGILWSNLTVLFCLSLIPVGTNWLGVRGISSFSIGALYSAVCALPSIPWITPFHLSSAVTLANLPSAEC